MNDRAPATKWNLINKMWIDHAENPKYSGDLSTCGIYMIEDPENIIKVNHSFILNNSRKLISLNSEIMCMLPDAVIPIGEFAKNIIAKKYSLPKQPTEFQLGNRKVEIRHSLAENQEEQQKNETDEGSLSNLIPFGTKITETIKNTNQTENKNYKKLKLASIIALPILTLVIIITFVISPTEKTKIATEKNKTKTKKLKTTRLKATSNKSATKKSKRRISEVKNKIKKRTTSSTESRKSKASAQKKKKSRRKGLMKKRLKTLPASIDGSDNSNDEDNIDETEIKDSINEYEDAGAENNDDYDEGQEDQPSSEDNFNDFETPEDTTDGYEDQESDRVPEQEQLLDPDQDREGYDAEQIAPENDIY